MKENFYVLIIAFTDENVVKKMGPLSERQAEKCDSGANINLDHDEYYTIIVEGTETEHGLGYMQGKGAA